MHVLKLTRTQKIDVSKTQNIVVKVFNVHKIIKNKILKSSTKQRSTKFIQFGELSRPFKTSNTENPIFHLQGNVFTAHLITKFYLVKVKDLNV